MSAQAHEITVNLGQRAVEAGLADVMIKRVGCLGLCAAGPLVEIAETGQLFERVRPDDVAGIITALAEVKPTDTRQPQGPFFEKQLRVATEKFRPDRPREPGRLRRAAGSRPFGGCSPR